uniref:Uncharacterized protein n=1 Tax=Cajanus cajan TaxID=3821 RepID=A0A151RAC1_CAJCA|nr:hypothetical protein KK1_039268 [Cajanus cajan]
MATSHANHHLATLLLLFLLLTTTSSSLARPFNTNYLGLAATEPTLNLALPSDRVVAPPEEDHPPPHVSPCGHLRVAGKKLGGAKYGPLVLNMLPKGPVPPSGPSKGTNDFNN